MTEGCSSRATLLNWMGRFAADGLAWVPSRRKRATSDTPGAVERRPADDGHHNPVLEAAAWVYPWEGARLVGKADVQGDASILRDALALGLPLRPRRGGLVPEARANPLSAGGGQDRPRSMNWT
jgi:hypothetical protein